MDNLIDEFVIEAGELLDEVERELLNIDQTCPLPKSTYSLIFRNFHSLKGSSGMMGLEELQRHTHLLEDRFQSYENRLEEIHKFIDYFLVGVDAARDLLHGRRVDFDFRQDVQADKTKEKEILSLYSKELIINDSELPIFYLVGFEEKFETLFLSNFKCYYYRDLSQFNADSKKIRNTVIMTKSLFSSELKGIIDTTRNEIFEIDNLSKSTLTENILFVLTRNVEIKENLNKAILLLMYQQSDLEEFLTKNKKLDTLHNIKIQIREILTFRNTLRVGSKK